MICTLVLHAIPAAALGRAFLAAVNRTSRARGCTGFDTDEDDPISTGGEATRVQAFVAIDGVAIVALFIAGDHTIAAGWLNTLRTAEVTVDDVAVVALLYIQLNDPISAGRCATTIQAFIAIDGVAIVALFDSIFNDAVPAHCDSTRVGAIIGIDGVAIVALFPFLAAAITTPGIGDCIFAAQRPHDARQGEGQSEVMSLSRVHPATPRRSYGFE